MGYNIFSMPAASTALLLSFAFGLTTAMPWTGPQETKVHRAGDFSPKPTGSPVELARLAKRDQWSPVNVCGWIAGRPESVVRCGAPSSCVHDTVHNVVGCCATAGPCTDGVYTTCLDSGKEGWKATQGLINNGVLSCKPSSTCYQNTFAGNYKQFSCGESKLVGDIQTTYEGQPADMKLQQVYTEIKFSPMSKALYTTVPFDSSSTSIPEAGKANPTESSGPGNASDKEDATGYIAGGTIGGLALSAIAIAGILLWLRRRKLKNGQRVGGFVSLDHEEKPPTSGPFKRMTRYSAHDFGPLSRRSTAQEVAYMSPTEDGTTYISPLTGHPNESHAPYNIPHERDQRNLAAQNEVDLLAPSPNSANTHNGAFPPSIYDNASTVPTSRLNIRSPSQSPSPQLTGEEQRQPLVSISVDDFRSTWQHPGAETGYGALGHQQVFSGDMPEGTDMGLVSTLRRAASQVVSGNSRTIDHNVRSESFRHSRVDSESHVNDFGGSIWDSQPMNPPTLHLSTPENTGSLGFNMTAGGGSTTSSNARTLVPGDEVGEGKEVFTGEKPLMEQMMEAFNKATRVGGEPSVVVKKDVYQLVDEGMSASGSEMNAQSGPSMNRGASNAALLRKPVGGTILHKRGASEGGRLI